MILGLISDTHGLLRPSALLAMQGVDFIIHAGDLGDPKILDELKKLAPLTVVRGNIDTGQPAESLPLSATLNAASLKIYVLHDVHDLDIDPRSAGISIVVSGHSHKPGCSERDGVLYINPGSAGPRRFNLPISAARLDLSRRPWTPDFLNLSGDESCIKPSE